MIMINFLEQGDFDGNVKLRKEIDYEGVGYRREMVCVALWLGKGFTKRNASPPQEGDDQGRDVPGGG
jgi:hypothetical protein